MFMQQTSRKRRGLLQPCRSRCGARARVRESAGGVASSAELQLPPDSRPYSHTRWQQQHSATLQLASK